MTQTEALKLALEALEVANSLVDGYYLPKEKAWLPEIEEAITAIKAALEAKDEPVVWNEGVPAMLPKQKEGETFIVSYEPKLEAKDEPIATKNNDGVTLHLGWDDLPVGTKLYATPPQRKPLTNQQIAEILERGDVSESNDKVGWYVLPYSFARAIEAAHGIKGEA